MNTKQRFEIYKKNVLASIPRILSELDRDPFSLTYGSFDREYWAWASKDFSNADLQRAIYPLTLLYLNKFEGNIWVGKKKVQEWIFAAMRFWKQSQHKNGSFVGLYPYEYSFGTVAFTLYEIGQSFLLLKKEGKLPDEIQKEILPSMTKAADFLLKSNERHGFISNHRLGASCALYIMHLITGNVVYKERAYYFIQTVIEKASKKEGWLLEYGGADPGYQTLDTYYLANFYRMSGDGELLNKLIWPSIKFITFFFHPDGSIGGEYGSRNCPMYYPSGFELLAESIPEAEAVARTGAYGITKGNTPSLLSMDIRNFVPQLSSYIQSLITCMNANDIECPQIPFEYCFERYWPEAGLFVRSDKKYYTVVGCSKGGVIKVFDKEKKVLIASHCGYMIECKNRVYGSNQFLETLYPQGLEDCKGQEVTVQPVRKIHIEHLFYEVTKKRVFTPARFLLFRIYNCTIGRIYEINEWVKRNIIIALFISRKKKLPFFLVRSLIFDCKELIVEDELRGKIEKVSSISAAPFFTTIYMASSKYYRHGELIKDHFSGGNYSELIKQRRVKWRVDNNGASLIK